MSALLTIEGGITIGNNIAIGNVQPTNHYWLMDSGYVGNALALGQAGAWNPGSTTPPFIEAYATYPETGIAIGVLNGGESLYTYNPQVMFTTYIATEDPADIPLALASVGIAYHTANLANPLGSDANSWGYREDGTVQQGGTQLAAGLPVWGPGDYIDIALNLNTATAWVRVNGGGWNGDPAAGTGGVALNMAVNGAAGSGTDVYPAVNPGAQNFIDAIDVSLITYSIPAGFTTI